MGDKVNLQKNFKNLYKRVYARLVDSLFEAHVFKKLAAIVAILMMIFLPQGGSPAADRGPASGKSPGRFRLGELTLSISDSSLNGDYLLRFSEDSKELLTADCAFKTHESKIVTGVPLPDCRTLLAYCFSGGAHCCTTLFIATECGVKCTLDMVDIGHTGGEVEFVRAEGTPGKSIKIYDWQFAYYCLEGSQIQLSFADSPAMVRLLIFDKARWRVDRIGEFSQFYSRLLRVAVNKARLSLRRHEPELAASLAMKAAYYNLMSGEPVEEATQILHRLLPAKWKPEAGNLVQDIYRRASEFDPVENTR